jgi:hypothetical protein
VALALVGACAHEGDEPMIILGNTAQMAGATTCTYTGDTTQPITSSGEISIVSPTGYILSPLIQSRVTAIAGQELLRTIELQGAIVELSIPNGSPSVALSDDETAFQALFAADVGPLGSVNVSFELVPESVLQKVGQLVTGPTDSVEVEVVAKITVFGTLGGDRVTAEPWQYPVTICNDCVVNSMGACPLTITTIADGDPCNVFQDGEVDCCTQGGELLCPGPTM